MQNKSHEFADVIYRLLGISGFGPARVNGLLHLLQNLNLISSSMSISELEKALFQHLNSAEISEYHHLLLPELANLHTCNPYHFITALDKDYPTCLKTISSAPPVVSYMGNFDLLQQVRIGFSGVRKVSNRAVEATTLCVEELVKKGICIVSGYANGVDSAAHYAALKAGGSTILILPYGLTYFDVKPHFKDAWDWNRVLVISEFVPSHPFSAHNAMQRNDTIIRLSKAVIIPEAGETGGSQATGRRALALKHPLFVAKYSKTPLGNSILHQRGALSLPVFRESPINIDAVMAVVEGAGMLF